MNGNVWRVGRLERALIYAVLIVGSLGCSTTSGQLRAQFARERGCPATEVTVRELGAQVYRAAGCGTSVEYVCGTFATMSGDDACVEQGAPRQAPVDGDPRPFPEPVHPLPGPGSAKGR